METDWVAEVFTAMRDCGEDVSIIFGTRAASQDEPRWFELQHDRFDGVSGLGTLLREQGLQVDAPPTLRGDRLTFLRGLRGLFAVLPALKVRTRTWRHFDGTRQVAFRPVRERLAWKIFSENETARIGAAARAAAVTVNTLLLSHLDAAVARRLASASSERLWMVPVNLRGAVSRRNEAAPHMAFLGVAIEGEPSLGALQSQIARLKGSAYHWGAWIILHAGRLIGAKGMRDDVRKRERKNHGWTGIFSNLGAWSVPGSGSWIFCPAISRVHPVGAGCVTMNGRMALAVQLHDAFECELDVAHALLDDWTRGCLGQPAREPARIDGLALDPAT